MILSLAFEYFIIKSSRLIAVIYLSQPLTYMKLFHVRVDFRVIYDGYNKYFIFCRVSIGDDHEKLF